MYGIDLLGACLGAVAVVPLMHFVPTPHLAAACGFLPLMALLLYGSRWRLEALVVIGLIGITMAFTPLLKVTRTKVYDESKLKPVYEKWTPTARLTIFDEDYFIFNENQHGFSWGRGLNYPRGKKIRQYWLEQDGSAGTPITDFDGDLRKVEFLNYDITTVGYQLRPPDRVAIVGGGGGRDILSALLAGADDIDVIELNAHTIEAVSYRFGDVSGGIYHRPGVHAFAREGRSHLTYSESRFDLIQISLIDSFAASAAGAFALAENNLYTVEAFQLYLDRLSDHGLLSTSRWRSEMPRLLILARAALLAGGYEPPERHLVLASARDVCTLLLSRQPFSNADRRRLARVADQRGFQIEYPTMPGHTGRKSFKDLIEGRFQDLLDAGLNADPPTDDSPYFFHDVSPFRIASVLEREKSTPTDYQVKWSATVIIRQAMVAVSLLAVVLFMLPLLRETAFRKRGTRHWSSLLRSTLFFAAIGMSFMLLENMLIQHFVLYLGHPSYAVTVIIASLLLGMGVGSNCAGWVGVDRLRRWGWIVPVTLVGLVAVLPPLFTSTLGLPLALRILNSCAILLPLGATLGLFFPLGMLRFGDDNKPWFWAINGVFGVVASVMSLALSMEFGFMLVGQISALFYTVAWLCLQGGGSGADRAEIAQSPTATVQP
jgi:hypothetical protein